MSTCSRSLSSNMSKSCCPQCDPGELNVFEAKRYFSDSLGVEEDGTNPGRLIERCMKEEKLSGGKEDISFNMDDMLENKHKLDERSSNKQSKSSAAKLANFLSSLFKQTIYKKKSKLGIEPQEKCPECRRRSISSSSFPQGSTNITCHSNNKFGGILFRSWKDDEKWCDNWAKDEANWLPRRGKSIDKEAILSEESMKKEEYSWSWMKEEEEEELERDGSESSSELFELKNFDLGNDVAAYGSTNLDVVKTKASSFPNAAF